MKRPARSRSRRRGPPRSRSRSIRREQGQESWVVVEGSIAVPASMAPDAVNAILLMATQGAIAPTIVPGAVTLIVPGPGGSPDPSGPPLPAGLVTFEAPTTSPSGPTSWQWSWHRSPIRSATHLIDLSSGLVPMGTLMEKIQVQRAQLERHFDIVDREGGHLYVVLVGTGREHFAASLRPGDDATEATAEGTAATMPEALPPNGAAATTRTTSAKGGPGRQGDLGAAPLES